MKTLLKQLLLRAGFSVQRLPAGIATGHDLPRDLRLVAGDRAGAVCIDAGAHVGDFTALVRQTLVRPEVHAFEPAPAPFARLRARFGDTAAVHLNAAGLSDRKGTIPLHIFRNEALNSFLPLAKGAEGILGGSEAANRIEAPILRLDDYAAEHGLATVDLLKIDTQGYELQVLRGAEGLLAGGKVRSVLIELNFVPLYAHQIWAHEVMALLHGHGLGLVDFYEKCRLHPHLGWCTALFTRRTAEAPH